MTSKVYRYSDPNPPVMGFCWPHLSPVGSSAWKKNTGSVLSRPDLSSELEFVAEAVTALTCSKQIYGILYKSG